MRVQCFHFTCVRDELNIEQSGDCETQLEYSFAAAPKLIQDQLFCFHHHIDVRDVEMF